MGLTQWSLTRQAEAVARGEVSARLLVEAHLERSRSLQPVLNAYTHLDDERALLRAELADRRRESGSPGGPLDGVPLAVKDLIDQRGLPTTAGSSFYRNVARVTAPAVARLEAAGAIVIGRTGLHEFAFGFSSENHWWGPVGNPWDPATSPGGSSGGSAAAVAAGLAAGALGTDTGGSVRVPAAVCGITGLKVTHGRVPLTGVFPLAPSLDTVGPLARSVADAALLYVAMAGHDPADRWSADRPVAGPAGAADLGRLAVAVPRPWVDYPVDPAVAAAFRTALDRLSDQGARVEEVTVPWLDPPGMIEAGAYGEIAQVHRRWYPARAGAYGPEVAERMEAVMATPVAATQAAAEWRRRVTAEAAEILARFDVLATPAVAASRKLIGTETVDVGGRPMPYRQAFSAFSALVNHLGAPALVLPLDAVADPPPALQLIGPDWSEHRLLEVGLALEEIGISHFRPPPIW